MNLRFALSPAWEPTMNRRWRRTVTRLGAVIPLCLAFLVSESQMLIAKDKDKDKEKGKGTEKKEERPALPADFPKDRGDLYQTAKLWDIHLRFSVEDWEKMEPKGGGRGPFGGGPGGRPGRGGGFGPGMFLAPMFLKEGDKDTDQKLSRVEFLGLGNRWFEAWDKDKTGKLNEEQLGAGLGGMMEQQGPGGPGGGPGPGRGGGGGGGGMNLQGPEGKRNGLASAAGIEFVYVRSDLEFEGQTFTNIAVRYKGNGTWMQSQSSLKRSMKLDLNEFVPGQKLAKVTKLNLHSSVTDASWMNEVLSYQLYRDAGVPAPRTAYAKVSVTVPGKHDHEYLGLYSMVEAVDSKFAEKGFDAKDGALFKPVTPNLFGDLGKEWAKYNQTYDPKTELTDAQKSRVIDFAQLVSHADDGEFSAKLGDYLDLDSFANYMSVTVWLSTLDSILGPGQNYYMYLHPKTAKFHFIPWDLDHSFGQFFLMGSQEQRNNLSILKPWRGENRFLERVFKVEAFKQAYLARMKKLNETLFQAERFVKQVDEVAVVIRPAVEKESKEKLERFDKVVAGELVESARFGGGGPGPGAGAGGGNRPAGGPGPGGGGPREGVGGLGGAQMVQPIKGFVKVRSGLIAEQLAGKSQGEVIGEFGFGGGRGGRGGPGGMGGRGGPGRFMGRPWMTALDKNEDQNLSREEFSKGFEAWFGKWDGDKDGVLSQEELTAGMNEDLSPFRGGGPGGGPGPGPGGPPPQ